MKLKTTCILLTTCLMACRDSFTDLSPVSQRNVNSFYRTADDMGVALNAAYKSLQLNGTYNASYWMLFEMRSDNTDQGTDQTGLGAELTVIENFTEIATSEQITNAYVDSYLGISRANIVLDRIEPI
ncbi:MAG: RagB/SusD family nutrient uptake outer membrane protein, partial [Ferruginibacter sp.]|nr:RagB/SusD family nutrient uptake outer membrane protein [Cytophagales bacterium]